MRSLRICFSKACLSDNWTCWPIIWSSSSSVIMKVLLLKESSVRDIRKDQKIRISDANSLNLRIFNVRPLRWRPRSPKRQPNSKSHKRRRSFWRTRDPVPLQKNSKRHNERKMQNMEVSYSRIDRFTAHKFQRMKKSLKFLNGFMALRGKL